MKKKNKSFHRVYHLLHYLLQVVGKCDPGSCWTAYALIHLERERGVNHTDWTL